MLYFTLEVFRRLANQNRGHNRVILESIIEVPVTYLLASPGLCIISTVYRFDFYSTHVLSLCQL